MGDIDLNEVSEQIKQPDRFVWVGLHEPDETLLHKVQEEFDLHDLAIEDALKAHQRPKLETYDDTVFIVLRTAQMNEKDKHIELGETHFFMGNNFIVNVLFSMY